MSAMIFCSLGLRMTSSRRRSAGLRTAPRIDAPLALQPPQERVGQATDEDSSRAPRLRRSPREKLAQIDRLAGAQRRVAAVRQKLRGRSELTRATALGPKTASMALVPALPRRCATRRTPAGRAGWGGRSRRCTSQKSAHEVVALDAPAPACLARRRGGRLRNSAALPPELDRALEVGRVALGGARAKGVEPPAAHRLEDPEAQIVGEAHVRQPVALGEVVEREEVDERQAAKNVDDRAAGVGLAHGARIHASSTSMLSKKRW